MLAYFSYKVSNIIATSQMVRVANPRYPLEDISEPSGFNIKILLL